MTKNWSHILLAAVVGLAPPGASMVRYTCDVSGTTTQIISTLGVGNHVDECCPDGPETQSLSSPSEDCCRATVFSLPQTISTPNHPASQAAPALVSFGAPAAEMRIRFATTRGAPMMNGSCSRNLPLLI